MALLDARGQGRFLFEVKSSLFPEGEITGTEIALWELYYTFKKEESENGGH